MEQRVLIGRALFESRIDDRPLARKPPLEANLKRLDSRIRELRTARGWSQEELARRVGVDRTYQSDVERGMRNFGVQLVFDYAKCLKVRLDDLLRL